MEGKTQETAAAKAGMSVRSARKWQSGPLPSQAKPEHRWRTRPDPFDGVWEDEIEPLLRNDPTGKLKATTIIDWLAEQHSGRFSASQLRTLQRRLQDWRALHGPEREVYFPQEHPPGREAQFDFTHCNSLGVTIAGQPYPHLLFQLILSHSGWRYAEVAVGETFLALQKGLQNALWTLGGVPRILRSDNTSAAAQEVTRGMREAASRGFWVTTYAPYGYKKVYVQDGVKKRPKLELHPPADAVTRRIFDMALQGSSILDVTKALNAEGVASPRGKQWLKTTVHNVLLNEAYTGTLVWGTRAKDGAPPVRVDDAHPAIVSKREFQRVNKLLGSRAPKKVHPRRSASPYLLSGLLRCETCGKAMTAAEAKSGKYTYYVCHSLLKRGKGTCKTPRLNAKSFEKLIVDEIRANVLTESNIRDLVKLLDEEMDGVAAEQRQRLETIEEELEDVKRRLGRIWQVIETTDIEMADASERIKEHRDRKEKLEVAAGEARALLKERRQFLDSADTIATFAAEMSEFLKTSELTETRAFVHSFVKEVEVKPGKAAIVYSIPTPEDSPIGGADAAEVALNGRVRSTVQSGGPELTVGRTIFEMRLVL